MQQIYLTETDEDIKKIIDDYDYSKYSNLDDFIMDEELKGKFAPIAKRLNLSQESVEMLLDIALEMSQKQKANYEKEESVRREENIAKYDELFSLDSEIPNKNSSHIKEYMNIANCAYREFASEKMKELLSDLGLVYHPEFIKMFHKIGELALEDNLMHCGKPPVKELTPAQILYGNTNSN